MRLLKESLEGNKISLLEKNLIEDRGKVFIFQELYD